MGAGARGGTAPVAHWRYRAGMASEQGRDDALARARGDRWLPDPPPTAALREVVGDRGRYDRAMSALQRHLLVTSAGVHAYRTGWPATLVDLTCRLFDVGGGPDHDHATARFVDTMVEAAPADLA